MGASKITLAIFAAIFSLAAAASVNHLEGAVLAERADQNGLNTLLDLPNRMKACWGAYGDRPISLVTCFTRISCSFLGQNQASCLRKTGNVQNFLDKMRPILTGMLGGLQG